MFVHAVALEVRDAVTDHVPWGKLTSLALLTSDAFILGEGCLWNGVGGVHPHPTHTESLAGDKFAIVGTALLACKSQGLALPAWSPVQWRVVYLFLIYTGS